MPSEPSSRRRVSVRAYRGTDDYQLVYDFLTELYEPDDRLAYWLPPRWEYMHGHPFIHCVELSSIGIVEDLQGRVLGVIHPEAVPEQRYLQLRNSEPEVLNELIDWAESHPAAPGAVSAASVGIFVDDVDTGLQALLAQRGYDRHSTERERHARLRLRAPLPALELPKGYRLCSLAEENDVASVDRVLWRGFGHPDEPEWSGVQERASTQATPHFRHDLNIVAIADDGTYAACAGIWYVPELRVAYVEPVATDPEHRRRGLGRAAVIEVLRRVSTEGADTVWVGSDQAFYVALGFEVRASSSLWTRALGAG